MKISILVLFCILACEPQLYSQRGMEIQISSKKVELGEPLMVTYSLSNYNERGLVGDLRCLEV